MEIDFLDTLDNSMNENLYDYFSVNVDSIRSLAFRESTSLDSICKDILEWEQNNDKKNIFLIDSYKESKRSTAAAFIALKLKSEKEDVLLVRNARGLKVGARRRKTGETGRPFIFINYIEGGQISEKEIQKIILSLGKRRIRDMPVVLSVPSMYSEFFIREEDSPIVAYPQNPISRAFVLLGIVALMTPFFNFPYMQIPIGGGSAVNDAGSIALALFIYALVLIISSRKLLSRKNTAPIAIALSLFILADIVAAQMLIPIPMGIPRVTTLPINLHITGNLGDISPIIVITPTLMKIASIAILPMGFTNGRGRKILTLAFLASLPIIYFSAALSTVFLELMPSISAIHVAQFSTQYPPLAVFYVGNGNWLLGAVAGLPSAALFFTSYIIISGNMKGEFIRSLKRTGKQGSAA